MQTITIKDGKRFVIKQEQVIDGKVVPSKAILADPAAYGVSEIQIEDRKDDRYYYNHESDSAPYITSTPKPAEQCREVVWNQIKAKRDNLTIHGGCKIGDYWFHTDEYSKLQQLALKVTGVTGVVAWKTMSGEFTGLDQAGVEALAAAQIERDKQIFTVAETYRTQLGMLNDVEAIAAFDYSTGWPQSYEESLVVVTPE